MAVNARSRQQGGRKKLLTGLAQEASNKIRSAVLLKGTASAVPQTIHFCVRLQPLRYILFRRAALAQG
jgi:hypothetical protein